MTSSLSRATWLRRNRTYQFRGRELKVTRGAPLPLGATPTPQGINFALLCRNGTAVTLALFDVCGVVPQAEIPLDPKVNRTGDHWHIRINGLPADLEFSYGYRVDGPKGPKHAYNPDLILIDPNAPGMSCGKPWGHRGGPPRYSLIADFSRDDSVEVSPRIPREDSILYELHVRGYTVHPSSGVTHPGTYAGLIEKIPYLKDLGVTGVELLPVDEFDENDCPFRNPFTGERHRNFWGYNTITFAAPKAAYASDPTGTNPLTEFRSMVRAFHHEGMEVILDVVFNHTAEGGKGGPTYSFRGLDNALYYMLDDQGRYLNFSGCGNTVNGNHPIMREHVISSLRGYVARAGIDGFRFDLASVFGRDRTGNVLVEPPIVEMITEDGLLADVKLIAEPWDAGGLYQVGSFPFGNRWMEWNGKFRDDVRRFWKGDENMVPALASRICGSQDLYRDRSPLHSVNFITCHDGFTLWDLVSYNEKHNEANGEGNRDGCNYNHSWNCGVEGETDDPEVLKLRYRQVRNLMATLLLSQGVPMILGGDEFLRTQRGNNNAWCQDNEIGWVDWNRARDQADFLRFVTMLIALRKRHPVLRRRTFLTGEGPEPDIHWHGVKPNKPDFAPWSRTLALAYDGRRCDRERVVDRDLYIAFNAYHEPLEFVIPQSPTGRKWRRAIDTARPSPHDIVGLDQGPIVEFFKPQTLEARSLLVLVSESR